MRYLLLIAVFILTTSSGNDGRKLFTISGFAQGTSYHITYYATNSLVSQAEIDNAFEKIDSVFSLYKNYSEISRFNRSENGIRISKHFQTVIKRSFEINTSTAGVFDITVYPLMEAWGFHSAAYQVPDSGTIKSLMKCIGSEKIHLSGDSLIKDRPCVRLDVNGIAQGYSVDVIAAILEEKGIKDYLVELGGELRVRGYKQPGAEAMRIGIEKPAENDFDPASLQQIISIDHGAITTSGSYRKYRSAGAKKISHLIDGRTGFPVSNELISVTVWAPDAITADGYDNSLMAMGLKDALLFIQKHPELEAFFIYRTKEGKIADTASAGFYKFINK